MHSKARHSKTTVRKKVGPAKDGDAHREGWVTLSSARRIVIPEHVFTSAGLKSGDAVQIRVAGPGRIEITRQSALLDKYVGALPAETYKPGWLESLRREWD